MTNSIERGEVPVPQLAVLAVFAAMVASAFWWPAVIWWAFMGIAAALPAVAIIAHSMTRSPTGMGAIIIIYAIVVGGIIAALLMAWWGIWVAVA